MARGAAQAQPRGQTSDQAVAVIAQKSLAKQNDFIGELEAYAPNFADALPSEIPVQFFKRVVITAVANNPDLLYANRRSLYTACMKAAVDGLLPDGRDGALVVYPNTRVKQRDPETGLDKEVRMDVVNWMPMVYGIRKRMRNTGEVASARAEAVFERDKFRYRLGDDEFIEHEPPPLGEDRGKCIGAYAIIRLTNGEVIRDVMNRQQIEAARAISRAKDGPMWTNFYWEAAKKTVLRRASKQAPTSPSTQRLLYRDEEIGDAGEHPALPPTEPEPQRETGRRATPEPEDTRPQFAVVDTDGVESLYGSTFRARDALLVVLEAASTAGLPALEGMWESNQALIDMLAAHGADDVAAELATEFTRLSDALKAKAKPAETKPPAQEPDRSATSHLPDAESGGGRVRAQPADRDPEPPASQQVAEHIADETRGEPENPLSDGRQGQEPAPPDDDGWPGPRVEDRALVCPEGGICSYTPAQCANGLSCQRRARGATRERPARTDVPANPTQAHSSPASAAADAKDEQVDPDRQSLAVPVPNGRNGKPDYRTWTVALFTPKLKRCRDMRTLGFFVGDNEKAIAEAKSQLAAADRADLDQAIAAQWRVVEQTPPPA